ncbi:hypothetical protein MYRA21_1775 [Myroides sp. A21]|uniref:hypothetical protein n=1 Tax=Myroides TaxID=76831 RepID=UPI00057C4A00|nr:MULTISPECIES: hypothetical protein [Myroides]AJA68925.1 hypothetical protein MYRA21_1775 [Myroides sp. A21]MEC4034328.1 hypothetical protein [Myroides odoratimimus]
MHGVSGGLMSELDGGKFISGFASGAISSMISSGIGKLGPKTDTNGVVTEGVLSTSDNKAMMIVGGGLSGGISSSIAGGDFMKGMQQGLITSGLNHSMHEVVYSSSSSNSKSLVDYEGEMQDAIANRTTYLEGQIESSREKLSTLDPSKGRYTKLNNKIGDLVDQITELGKASRSINSVLDNIKSGKYIVNVFKRGTIVSGGRELHGGLSWGSNRNILNIYYNGKTNVLIHEAIHVHNVMFSKPIILVPFEANTLVRFKIYGSEIAAFRVSYSLGDKLGVGSMEQITDDFLKKNGY